MVQTAPEPDPEPEPEPDPERPRHHFLVVALIGLTTALAPLMLLIGALDATVEDRYGPLVLELVSYGWILALFSVRNNWRTATLSWNFSFMMVVLGVGTSFWYVHDPIPLLFITMAMPVAGMLLGWRGAVTMAVAATVGMVVVLLLQLEFNSDAVNAYQWGLTNGSCLIFGLIVGGASAKLNEAIRIVPDPVTIRDWARERELERRLAMAERDRALGGLARAVAHDFNNFLTPIISTAELAQRSAEDPTLRDDLTAIMVAGEQARDLVRTILDFQRSDKNAVVAVDLGAAMRDTLTLLSKSDPSNDVHFSCSVETECVVKARHSDIQRVVMNLVTNAQRAVSPGGRIGVRVYESRSDAQPGVVQVGISRPRAPYATLEISDDGAGISDKQKSSIFEPFVTFSQGTGLGLSTVREIVEELDGCIFVESAVGKGTTFVVLLPLATS